MTWDDLCAPKIFFLLNYNFSCIYDGAPAAWAPSIKLVLGADVSEKLRLFRWDVKGGMIFSYYLSGFSDSTTTDYLTSGSGITPPTFGRIMLLPIYDKLFDLIFPAGGKSAKASALVD